MTNRKKAFKLYHEELRERFDQSDTDILETILFDFLSGEEALKALEYVKTEFGLDEFDND